MNNKYKILLVEDDENIQRKLGIRPGDDSYIVNELRVGYRMITD